MDKTAHSESVVLISHDRGDKQRGLSRVWSENAFHQATRKHKVPCPSLCSPDTVLGRMSQILRITCLRIDSTESNCVHASVGHHVLTFHLE